MCVVFMLYVSIARQLQEGPTVVLHVHVSSSNPLYIHAYNSARLATHVQKLRHTLCLFGLYMAASF